MVSPRKVRVHASDVKCATDSMIIRVIQWVAKVLSREIVPLAIVDVACTERSYVNLLAGMLSMLSRFHANGNIMIL